MCSRRATCVSTWVIACVLGACEPAGDTPCYGDIDCPEGQICSARGQCVEDDSRPDGSIVSAVDAADDDRAPVDGGGPRDRASGVDTGGHDSGGSADAAPAHCVDWDGVITRAELPFGPDRSIRNRTIDPESPATVDLVGAEIDGVRTWDFSAEVEGEFGVVTRTSSLEGRWYASDYPEADYTAPLDDSEEILGVFKLRDDRIELLGVVSTEPDQVRTFYDPPVVVYQLPMHEGDSWITEATVEGIYDGADIWWWLYEDYTSEVVGSGKVKVPAGTFDVLVVRTVREQTAVFNLWVSNYEQVISYFFVAQCYGPVATISSEVNEAEDPFTTAPVYRRLGL